MLAAGVALVMLAAAPPVPTGGAVAPQGRVMSINQCTDQLVLALLPPSRIASVSWLARDPGGSLFAAASRRVAINRGTAEEVARQRPALVLAGPFTTPATRALLKRLHYPMIEVPDAASFADIRRITRQVAAAVGARARGAALIARMDHVLALLARSVGPRVRVAAWDGAGLGASPGSLYAAILDAAGAVNVATLPPVAGRTTTDTEILLAAAPEVLVRSASGGSAPDLHAEAARHPLVRRLWKGRTVDIRSAYFSCGTPFSAEAAVMLRAKLRATQR